jgi:hypothetical protein
LVRLGALFSEIPRVVRGVVVIAHSRVPVAAAHPVRARLAQKTALPVRRHDGHDDRFE